MSESMTAVEIEDVLSSIRRLVSEDLRPTHKLVSAALKSGASKLILTPALRIVSDERAALPERGDAFYEDRDLATVLQDIDVEDAGQTADIVPVFGSVRLHEHLDQSEQERQFGGDTASSDANFLATAMSRINGLSSSDPAEGPLAQRDRIEAVVATVGAAVGPEEWEVDGGDPAPQTQAWGDTVWNPADAVVEDAAVDDAVQVTEASDVLVLETPIAPSDVELGAETLLHDLQAETVLQSEHAATDADLVGADSIIFNDDILSQPGAAAPSEAVVQSGFAELDDTADFLNEDILREIVREMIQQELQGTLGERITHSVRKLVRAEVNRALAAHDYGDRVSHA
jgi:cell pole-organizing protein PopZ